jgi:hypothetical protein
MSNIVPDQEAVTASEFDGEPTGAELADIEFEMPVILAEVELLDVQISLLDRPLHPINWRRLRRAEHRLLAARSWLAAAETELAQFLGAGA